MSDFENLKSQLFSKIQRGEALIESLNDYKIEGIPKLQRKIRQEVDFLNKVNFEVLRNGTLTKEHLQCTNLTHFEALLGKLRLVPDCIAVGKPFVVRNRKIVVDIVCDEGRSWVKVVARNPRSLSQISMGNSNYGVRTICDQAEEFLECSNLHKHLFQPPKITFYFSNGIGGSLAKKLESLGLTVEGERLDFDSEESETTESNRNPQFEPSNCPKPVDRVNLDVSAMLAYCSSVTNGSCDKYKLKTQVLAQQAKWESERPVKPKLEKFFEGKQLFCCETAKSDFMSILHTVGGPNERIRGYDLLKRVTVLPDDAIVGIIENDEDDGMEVLEVGGKIRERALKIFRFGDRIKAITVTANVGFIRAARQKGVHFAVFVHESRALTEQKESRESGSAVPEVPTRP